MLEFQKYQIEPENNPLMSEKYVRMKFQFIITNNLI